MSKADQYRSNALHEVGEDYHWGDEGTGGVAGDDDYDCSGFTWAMLNDVGVKMPRMTANDYMRRGVKITAPTRVGSDFGVMIDGTGHATHIAPYIGRADIVEARGKAYGVVKTSVAAFKARGAHWYRFPGVDLGELTTDVPAPIPRKYPGHIIGKGHKHHDEVSWVQKRLNHHGLKVTVDGDYGSKTAAAVHVFRCKQGTGAWRYGSSVGPETWRRLGL